MSFTTDNISLEGDIEVIVRIDSSLDCTDEEYQEYLATLDESKLKLKDGVEGPAKFILRRSIPLKHATRIENAKLKVTRDEEVSLQMGYMIEEVRATLKEVRYPSESQVPDTKRIRFKFTGDGLLDEGNAVALHTAGIVSNLYWGRTNALRMRSGGVDIKKN